MGTPATRAFTRARLVALALMGLAVLALVYLRVAPDSGSISVPAEANAGDLTLEDCEYATENGGYRADCGTLVVPENRHDPNSRLIALPVKRIRARSPNPGAPIFYFHGGPGGTTMNFPAAGRFAEDHDVVLVGYRGVDGSVRLDCPEVVASRERSGDWLGTASLESDAAAFRSCADRLRADGVDLAGYTLPQRVDDMELARSKLGYGSVDLVSESFGTRVALVYTWRYPESIHRSVMIGVNPPGHFLWDAKTAHEQLRRYAALCAKDQSCAKRTDDLAASVESGFARIPERWLFLPIKQGNVQALALFGLFNVTSDAAGPLAAPLTLDTLLSLDEGDASGAWLLSVLAQTVLPRAQVSGDAAAMGLSDAAYARRFFASHSGDSAIGSATTQFMWAGGRLAGAWPVAPDHGLYNSVPESNVETLLVGGELDLSTPPQIARRQLLPHLPNGQQVVLPKLGHTEDFWTYEPKASTRLIESYLDGGRVDTSLYTENRVDFEPGTTQRRMAKIALALILALAALTVLSLLSMALRVQRRGRIGRRASGVVRSLLACLLGLGGLMLGVLIALTALPTVAITDDLFVALSEGVPIGLCLYLAWVNRDWSAQTRAMGFVAAVTGALTGAWLGFNATEVPLALLTGIVGSVVGGNVILLALDIAWDRWARDRFIAPDVTEILEARG